MQREGEGVEGSECLYSVLYQYKKATYLSIRRQHIRAAYVSLRRQQKYTNSAGVYQSRKDSEVAPRQRITSSNSAGQ
jgi:hypothetical protein